MIYLSSRKKWSFFSSCKQYFYGQFFFHFMVMVSFWHNPDPKNKKKNKYHPDQALRITLPPPHSEDLWPFPHIHTNAHAHANKRSYKKVREVDIINEILRISYSFSKRIQIFLNYSKNLATKLFCFSSRKKFTSLT